MLRLLSVLSLIMLFAFSSAPAQAQVEEAATAKVYAPENWGIDFQGVATPVQQEIHDFHKLLMVIITAITLFVLILLTIVIIRFRRKANPVPSKTTHNTVLEVIWTAVPILILVVIAIPSMKLLYYADKAEEADLTIKAIGRQWYWSYEYPDHGDISFDSAPLDEKDLKPGQKRLLSVDKPLVVPVGATVRILITSSDVIHAWGVPSLGVKRDAIPGRLNETWFRIDEEGTFFGHCYEICGPGHAYMPVEVRAVSPAKFKEWVLANDGKMPLPEIGENENTEQISLSK